MNRQVALAQKESPQVKKMRFRGRKGNLRIASFLFINRSDDEDKLDEKYSGSSFPYSATRISTACSEKPISILTWDHISYFPRKLLKWHQEEVSEGQDENPGERGIEQRAWGERWQKERQRDNDRNWDSEEEKGKKIRGKKETKREEKLKETESKRERLKGMYFSAHFSTTHPCPLPF